MATRLLQSLRLQLQFRFQFRFQLQLQLQLPHHRDRGRGENASSSRGRTMTGLRRTLLRTRGRNTGGRARNCMRSSSRSVSHHIFIGMQSLLSSPSHAERAAITRRTGRHPTHRSPGASATETTWITSTGAPPASSAAKTMRRTRSSKRSGRGPSSHEGRSRCPLRRDNVKGREARRFRARGGFRRRRRSESG